MKEIDIEIARNEISNITTRVPDNIQEIISRAVPGDKQLFYYAYDLFTNKLRYKNSEAFLEDIIKSGERAQRNFEYFSNLLPGKSKAIDIGCGWGGLTSLICQHKVEEVFAVDHVWEHAVATKIRAPRARVFCGDGRTLPLLEDNSFDLVIANDVIEHIGDYSQPIGPSGNNLLHQYNFLSRLSAISRTGGALFISTGNYLFPWDGETNLWFYHWLPSGEKSRFNEIKKISTDKYFMLTWEELSFLLNFTGFSIISVDSPDKEAWDRRIFNRLDLAFDGLDKESIDLWKHLVKTNPKFFSSWHVIARKNGEKNTSEKKPNHWMLARLHGVTINHLEKELDGCHIQIGRLMEDLERIGGQLTDCNFQLGHLQEELQKTQERLAGKDHELGSILNSRSYKIGRAVTWPKRFLAGFFK